MMNGCSGPRARRGCSPQDRRAMDRNDDRSAELRKLIDDLGLEMKGVELDRDSAAGLELGCLLHRHTDNINIR